MKKVITILALIALAITGAFAYNGYAQRSNVADDDFVRGSFHSDVYQIVESGTYEDLLDLREEVGRSLVRWVDSEEDFNSWKEMHEQREAQGVSGPNKAEMGHQRGSHNGQGRGGGLGNCMFDN